jgi:nicotinamide-nucleotide amidase
MTCWYFHQGLGRELMEPLNIGYLVIGNEILQGYTTDTNSIFLSRHLSALGHKVDRILTVGDDVDKIVKHLRDLLHEDLDVIFVCGGLGSTPDDVTMDAVGKALKLPLSVHPKAKGWIAERINELHSHGRIPSDKMAEPHLRMARVPKGAKVLHNRAGSAPGVVVTVPSSKKGGRSKTVIILPGVPKELKYLYLEEIENKVLRPSSKRPYVEEITVNIAESTMDGVLKQFNNEFPTVYLGSYPQDDSSVILRVSGDKSHVLASVKKLRQELGKISQRDFL